ncbi:MAG: 50S ribosomal protein L4 [Prevotella sp.]|nr:50S ribosomal protein L4 [Prevotella sp.]
MELNVLNIKGQETGRKVALNEAIFGIEPNDHVIYLDVKQYMANQRQGNAKSKERSEISGSTRKLGRQKGGGGARHGDINSPLLRGGGRVFGPKPRDYSFKLNKKVKQLARRSALSTKAIENAILIIEDFSFDAPKTKEMVNIVKNLKGEEKKVLFVLPEANKNVYLSARNLNTPKQIAVGELQEGKKHRSRKSVSVEVLPAADINTYKILNADMLVITEKSLETIDAVLNK